MWRETRKTVSVFLLIGLAFWTAKGTRACTTILIGKAATSDGSVLMATSCDGNIMGRVHVVPAKKYPKGHELRMFYDSPAPSTWQEQAELASC
jgi:hypothetical protein